MKNNFIHLTKFFLHAIPDRFRAGSIGVSFTTRLTALLLLFTFNSTAQSSIKRIIDAEVIRLSRYQFKPGLVEKYFVMNCLYGKPGVGEKLMPDVNIDTLQITAVDLVFTDHPSDKDLKKLNSERLKNLFSLFPALADNADIEWRVIRQMDGAEKEQAVGMFHGFAIYYRPLQTKELMKTDLAELKKMLTPVGAPSTKKRNGFITGDTAELRKNYEIEEYTIVQKLPVNEAIRYLNMDPAEKITYRNYDSVFVYEKPTPPDNNEKRIMLPPPDSTVIKVLDRMRWSRMLTVADVTASMYPYTGQLMLWLKAHEDERPINHFIFFNDGDNRDDDTKSIGQTGGIYSTGSSVFEVVESLAFKAMTNGCGGSIPENNVEALLSGIKACNDCASVVMIADNASPVTDMALLNKINKPVHIILCGVREKVHADYLNIARITGGSIHLAGVDISNLTGVKDGDFIEILGRKYFVKDGKFHN